jgi:hypothetical protein
MLTLVMLVADHQDTDSIVVRCGTPLVEHPFDAHGVRHTTTTVLCTARDLPKFSMPSRVHCLPTKNFGSTEFDPRRSVRRLAWIPAQSTS